MLNPERAAHVAQLELLRRAALSVVDGPDAPVSDPAAWQHPSGEFIGWRLTWPTDEGLSAWVQANMHLACTALLSCADQIAGLLLLAAGDPSPMLAVGSVCRSTVEAAGQAWWLREPLLAPALDDEVWPALGARACAVAASWYGWSAKLSRDFVAGDGTARAPLDPELKRLLAVGEEEARESAKAAQANLAGKEGRGVTFRYTAAAVALLDVARLPRGLATYARLCEASHANPLAITRSDPTPKLMRLGLMPLDRSPSSSAVRDDETVDTFLLEVVRCVHAALVEGFAPLAGRTWGLAYREHRELLTSFDDWIDRTTEARPGSSAG